MAFMFADISENISEGLLNMAAGLIIVFGVLIFLSLIISCFKYVNAIAENRSTAKAAPTPAAAPVPAKAAPAAPAAPVGPGTMAKEKVSFDDEIEGPIAAVILAAVAQTCGGNFKVTSIKKHK
jgi:Na+-transporting methylmalonyl-CoA/oxaloacetate decarboxylase gamma subunit